MKWLITSCLVLSSLQLFAQQTATKRTCRILFLEKPRGAPSEAYLFNGSESIKVRLPSMNLGQVIELPAGPLKIGMTAQPVSSPDLFPQGAPTTTLPEQFNDIYLLVVNDKENKEFPVRLQSINIGNDRLKAGQTLWINFTKHRIAAKLGNQELLIAPMKRSVSKPPLPASGYFKAHFLYQPQGADEFYPIMKKSWWFDATAKNLGFIIGTDARLPKIFMLRDRRDAESKKSIPTTQEP